MTETMCARVGSVFFQLNTVCVDGQALPNDVSDVLVVAAAVDGEDVNTVFEITASLDCMMFILLMTSAFFVDGSSLLLAIVPACEDGGSIQLTLESAMSIIANAFEITAVLLPANKNRST